MVQLLPGHAALSLSPSREK